MGGSSGERGIRTLGTVTRTHDFQSCTFDHSVISPGPAGPGDARPTTGYKEDAEQEELRSFVTGCICGRNVPGIEVRCKGGREGGLVRSSGPKRTERLSRRTARTLCASGGPRGGNREGPNAG